MSAAAGDETGAGLLLLDASLVDDGVVEAAGSEELESVLDVVEDGVLEVDVSALVAGAAVLVLL